MIYQRKKQSAGMAHTIKEMVWLLFIVFIIRTFGFGLYQVPTGSMETTMLVGERFFADKFTILFSKPKRGDVISFNDPKFNYSSNSLVRLYQEYVGWPIWPWGPMNWTKRVIGVPGDHVRGTVENGVPVVYLNEQKLDEPYVNKYPLLAVADPSFQDIDWRSYDPAASFNDQPFYRVVSERIIHPDMIHGKYYQYLLASGVIVTAEQMMLKEPYKQIKDFPYNKKVQGDSFWTDTDEFDVHLGPDQYWCLGDNRRGSHDCRYFGPIAGRLIHGKIIWRIWSIDSVESWWIVDLIKHPIDFWKRMRWSRFFQRVR